MLATLSSFDSPISRSPLTFCPRIGDVDAWACAVADPGFPRRGGAPNPGLG